MKSSARIAALSALVAATALLASSAAAQAPKKPTANDLNAASRFAWYVFTQAMKPMKTSDIAGAPLQFERWQEQCDLQPKMLGCSPPSVAAARTPGAPQVRMAHGSLLASVLRKRLGQDVGAPSEVGCGGMNVNGFPGYPGPTNVTQAAVFCEEVFVNHAESTFVTNNKLITLAAQEAYGKVTFPGEAIEIKVDWVPMSSFTNPFSCPDKNVYTETIQFAQQPAQCYALVSIHISSKVLPDWLWATFEPNYPVTNPNRCDPKLYSACYDPWGTTSKQPYGPGLPVTSAKQSPALARLMKVANLDSVFNNYFLTGVQTQFVNVQRRPVPLGNSFTEFNAGVPPGQASCITCHNYAYAGTTSLGGPPKGWPSTGYACNQPNAKASCFPPTGNNWTSEDFSWLLGFMPQN